MFHQASTRVKVAVGLIFANWVVCSVLAYFVGTAFYGEISDGSFIVRRGVTAPGVAVTSAFWGFSLFYTILTVGGSFVALALLETFHKPQWNRGSFDVVLIAGSVTLALLVLGYSAPRILAWAAA